MARKNSIVVLDNDLIREFADALLFEDKKSEYSSRFSLSGFLLGGWMFLTVGVFGFILSIIVIKTIPVFMLVVCLFFTAIGIYSIFPSVKYYKALRNHTLPFWDCKFFRNRYIHLALFALNFDTKSVENFDFENIDFKVEVSRDDCEVVMFSGGVEETFYTNNIKRVVETDNLRVIEFKTSDLKNRYMKNKKSLKDWKYANKYCVVVIPRAKRFLS